MKKIVTHNGNFHPDDVLAVATLQLYLGLEDVEVIRTRDEDVINQADWVVDVGGVYDVVTKRFDHHQNNSPKRTNGIPYSSFGLVWKELGKELCGSSEGARQIEDRLAQPVDAGDNAVSLYEKNALGVSPYELFHVIGSYRPVQGSEEQVDEAFMQAVEFARNLLLRLISHVQAEASVKAIVKAVYEKSDNKSILVFDAGVNRFNLTDYPDVKVIVYPSSGSPGQWKAATVPTGEKAFESKVDFPAEWNGLHDEELSKVSGIVGAVFSHKGRFLFVAKTKEAAVAAAKQAR